MDCPWFCKNNHVEQPAVCIVQEWARSMLLCNAQQNWSNVSFLPYNFSFLLDALQFLYFKGSAGSCAFLLLGLRQSVEVA